MSDVTMDILLLLIDQQNNNETNMEDLVEIINNTADTLVQQSSIPKQPYTSTGSAQPSISNQQSTSIFTASAQPSTAVQQIPSIPRRKATAASNQLLPQQHQDHHDNVKFSTVCHMYLDYMYFRIIIFVIKLREL